MAINGRRLHHQHTDKIDNAITHCSRRQFNHSATNQNRARNTDNAPAAIISEITDNIRSSQRLTADIVDFSFKFINHIRLRSFRFVFRYNSGKINIQADAPAMMGISTNSG
jgi:hypothetical protein